MHQSHVLKGAKSDRTVISIPEIPSLAPNHRENLLFTEKEPPNSMVPKLAETKAKLLHCVHIAHANAGILTQDYLSPI